MEQFSAGQVLLFMTVFKLSWIDVQSFSRGAYGIVFGSITRRAYSCATLPLSKDWQTKKLLVVRNNYDILFCLCTPSVLSCLNFAGWVVDTLLKLNLVLYCWRYLYGGQ